ncbi:MAG: hypothetical protein ABIP03_00725 [Aquihabitans sp.]
MSYLAYAIITKGGVTRSGVLLDIGGVTPVAFTDGSVTPGVEFHMSVAGVNDGGAFGAGINVWVVPTPGHDLSDLTATIVINPGGSTEGTTEESGSTDFVVLEFVTGAERVPALLAQVGQIAQAVHQVDAGPPVEKRVDDVYLVEVAAAGGAFPLHVRGGLVSGPMAILPGTRVSTGPYTETPTSIRGIDLSRVEPSPGASATSPTSATWFDVTARPNGPAPITHLAIRAGMPHVGEAPGTAPAAAISATPGSCDVGSYRYRVAFVHPNGNETRRGPAGNVVTLTATGAVDLTAIPTGAEPPDGKPELAVSARRIYRQGPGSPGDLDGFDEVLVGELPGLAATGAPSPLPTTFTDGLGEIRPGLGIAPGHFRAPDRLRVRYHADTPLDLTGTVLLVEPGPGLVGRSTYRGSVTAAPTDVEVVQDDRADLRMDLDLATTPLARIQWKASSRAARVVVQLPELSVAPFGKGVEVRIDDAPHEFGFDWRLQSSLLSVFDIRGQRAMTDLEADAAPDPDHVVVRRGPSAFGLVALRMGPGSPAPAWPEGEATVGVELYDIDEARRTVTGAHGVSFVRPHGAVAVRGLRWVQLVNGDGFGGFDDPERLRVDLLLGDDPTKPPGGDRTLRFFRLVRHADAPDSDTSWWGRVGKLPDRLGLDVMPITLTRQDQDNPTRRNRAMRVNVAGEVERIVGNVFDHDALADMNGTDGTRAWLAIDGTGPPEHYDDEEGPVTASLRLNIDDRDQFLRSSSPLLLDAALTTELLGRTGRGHARLRVPNDLRAHTFIGDKDRNDPSADRAIATDLSASAGGLWGRLALAWSGPPVATRSSPQVGMRRRPDLPSTDQLDAATARFGPIHSGKVTISPKSGGLAGDPVSRIAVDLSFANRVNRSFRGDQVEVDPRVQPDSRAAISGRIGEVADHLSIEIRKNEDQGGKPFFFKGSTSSALSDGQLWAEPAQFRDPGSPRGDFAGMGNLSLHLEEAPTEFEYVDLAGVPFRDRGSPEYAGAEELPRVHPPGGATKEGGFRLQFTGRAAAHGNRIVVFKGDDTLGEEELGDIDQNTLLDARKWSSWHKTLIPKLDIRSDPSGAGGSQTLWIWLYDSPPPPLPDGVEGTSGKAFRMSDGLLVDLAMRDYKVHDDPNRTSVRWNEIAAGTYTTTIYVSPLLGGMAEPEVVHVPYGTWQFDTDIQMKGYRGEVTIVDAPSLSEKLDNPYGDWEAGPGEWYLRARDKLKIVTYTGDLYMGNTGNGYHIPLSNGLFSTLRAPYNLVWP